MVSKIVLYRFLPYWVVVELLNPPKPKSVAGPMKILLLGFYFVAGVGGEEVLRDFTSPGQSSRFFLRSSLPHAECNLREMLLTIRIRTSFPSAVCAFHRVICTTAQKFACTAAHSAPQQQYQYGRSLLFYKTICLIGSLYIFSSP